MEEVISQLAKTPPVWKEEDESYRSFIASLPIKFRKKTGKDEEAEREALAKEKDSEKEDKKKKPSKKK